MCSSTNRVCTLPAAKSGWPRMACRKAMLVSTPSMRNSLSAREVRADGVPEVVRRRMTDHLGEQRIERQAGLVAGVAEAVGAHARPARGLVGGERAGGRQNGAVVAHRLHAHPGLHSVAAWRRRSRRVRVPRSSRPRPASTARWTMSTPVTSSVTVCSTWSRALVSMNANDPVSVVAGVVDQELEGSGVAVADAAGEPHRGVDDRVRAASSASPGAGATSTIFWKCRCTLHSRSPRWAMPPSASPRICTSTCRARSDELLHVEVAVAERWQALRPGSARRWPPPRRRRPPGASPGPRRRPPP